METKIEKTKGVAKYIYLDSTEKFHDEDTGKYTITIAVSDAEVKKLEKLGVKVREFQDEDGESYKARKFSTKFKLNDKMIMTESGDHSIGTDFGRGSNVEVWWRTGNKHPTHGTATYLTAIKVADDHEPGFVASNEELAEFFG